MIKTLFCHLRTSLMVIKLFLLLLTVEIILIHNSCVLRNESFKNDTSSAIDIQTFRLYVSIFTKQMISIYYTYIFISIMN